MAIFDRFRRNRQQSVLPDEVKQYYQTENRQRRGMAVLLAVVALVATVAVAAGLFFGGRYIYQKINDNNKTAQPATENQNGEEQNPADNFGGTEDNQGSNPDETPPATPPTSTPSNPETQTPTPPPAPAPAPQTTPSPLPHTGDEGM